MLLVRKVGSFNDENTHALAKESLQEIRNISNVLHPTTLSQVGLTSAVEALIHKIDANTDIFFTSAIENIDGLLNTEQELHLYRIIQESLNNVVKHAEAKAAEVSLAKNGSTLSVKVRDNGKGFVFY